MLNTIDIRTLKAEPYGQTGTNGCLLDKLHFHFVGEL